MKLTEKTIRKKKIYSGRVVQLAVHQVQLPNGRFSYREIVSHPGAAAIVPVLPGGKIILVNQYRKAVAKTLWEIPAGTLAKHESPRDCALRELAEETGYRARYLKKIAVIYPSPGYSNESIHIFKAAGLKKTISVPEADEFIEPVIISPLKLKKLISTGNIKDSKTLIALKLLGL